MEIAEYPSVIGVEIEVRAHDSNDKYTNKFSQVNGRVKREIRDVNGGRYFIVELANPVEGIRFLTVSERYAGVSIPREFSRRPDRPVVVGIGAVKDESVLNKDVFDIEEVEYFAIGEILRRGGHEDKTHKKKP